MKKILLIVLFFVVLVFYGFSLNKVVHFSIDDVSTALKDLTEHEKKYNCLFEQKFFKYIKYLNEKYGVKVILYCFYEQNGFCLVDCTQKFSNDFTSCSGWLKFGYHAFSPEKTFDENYSDFGYKKFVKSVLKITGNKDSITRTVRLDRFQGSQQEIESCSWRNTDYGILCLLTADSRDRYSYYLTKYEIDELNINEYYYDEYIDIKFYVTDFRFDDYKNFNSFFEKNMDESELVVFTHEAVLNAPFRKNFIKFIMSKWRQFWVRHNIEKFLAFYADNEYEYITEF